MIDISTILICSNIQEQILIKSILELLKPDVYKISVTDCAADLQEAYRAFLLNPPSLVIVEESMMTPCFNLLCSKSEVVVITDKKDKSDMSNIHYAYLAAQPAYLLKKITKIYDKYSDLDFLNQTTAVIDFIKEVCLPSKYCFEIDNYCASNSLMPENKVSPSAQRSFVMDAISKGVLVLTNDSEMPFDTADEETPISEPSEIPYVETDVAEEVVIIDEPEVSVVGEEAKTASSNPAPVESSTLFDFQESATPINNMLSNEPAAPALIKVELERLPCVEFLLGSTFSAAGGLLSLYYDDGSISQVETCNAMLTKPYDLSKPGHIVITLNVDTFAVAYKIDITKPDPLVNKEPGVQPISFMVNAVPFKTIYPLRFKSFDLSGGMITVFYSDNSCKQLPLDDSMEYALNKNVLGTIPVMVKYLGLQAVFPITLEEPKINDLTMISQPNKSSYFDGDEFIPDGLSIMGIYDNGEETVFADFPNMNIKLALIDTCVSVNVEGKTLSVPIRVATRPIPTLSVKTMPNKTVYIAEHDTLNLTGCVLEKTTATGEVLSLPATLDMVKSFSSAVIGDTSVVLTDGDLSCAFSVRIVPDEIVSLKISHNPEKDIFVVGEVYDLSGMVIAADMKSGTEQVINDYSVSKKSAALNDTEIVISYLKYVVSLPVKVLDKILESISVSILPNKTSYMEQRDIFSAFGGELQLRYNTGDTELIKLTNEMVSGFSNKAVGDISLTVVYKDLSTNFTVSVAAKQLLGISISSKPSKSTYVEGEHVDLRGLQLTGIYNNGQTVTINDFQYAPQTPVTMLDNVIEIHYQDKSVILPISIIKPEDAAPIPEEIKPKRPIFKENKVTFYPNSTGLRF